MLVPISAIEAFSSPFYLFYSLQLEKYPSIVKIERTTGVPKGYAAIGGFVLFTLVSRAGLCL